MISGIRCWRMLWSAVVYFLACYSIWHLDFDSTYSLLIQFGLLHVQVSAVFTSCKSFFFTCSLKSVYYWSFIWFRGRGVHGWVIGFLADLQPHFQDFQNGSVEKTLTNSRTCDHKISQLEACHHFELIKTSNIFGGTYVPLFSRIFSIPPFWMLERCWRQGLGNL